MATVATTTVTPIVSFRRHSSSPSATPRSKPTVTPKPQLLLTFPQTLILSAPLRSPLLLLSSVDVSKDDKPVSDEVPPSEQEPEPEPEKKLDPRRPEERFAVLNTGIYECRSCGYMYDEAAGDPSYPIPAGLEFAKMPEDWRCPTCGAAKTFFESKRVEIAGFAQNQQFGLGGNALTSSQKAVLIYGSLFFLFLLFLSGYFLQ